MTDSWGRGGQTARADRQLGQETGSSHLESLAGSQDSETVLWLRKLKAHPSDVLP